LQRDTISWEDAIKLWSEVTGRQVRFIQCSTEEFEKLWGPIGT
jgi:hypothetical protein